MSEHIKTIIPVVINRCYGGFSLSEKAQRLLAERKGIELEQKDGYLAIKGTWKTIYDFVPRNDPDMVSVVNEFGGRADGECSRLEVVDIHVSIDIDSFDGKESVSVSGYESYY